MKEIKISGYKKNARKEISFKILIKEGDYTLGEDELIQKCEINGDLPDLDFSGLIVGDKNAVRNKNLQILHNVMLDYCEKENLKFVEEVKFLYQRNKVESRTELTDSQLDQEIEKYKNGCLSK